MTVKLIENKIKNRIKMFWILRRTEAFLNSFNNNPSKNITRNYERRNSGEFFIKNGTELLNYSSGNIKEIKF